jgi:acylphosphatase
VRNRRDGTVEALVQGDAVAVEAVVAWCRRGPPAARVTDVDVADARADASCTSFALRATV